MNKECAVITNIAEAFHDFILLDESNHSSALALEQTIEEQGLFWTGNNSIVVTSNPINPEHQTHLAKALDYINMTLYKPESSSGRLSLDILHDSKLLGSLIDLSNKTEQAMVISPYCVTPEFVNLVDEMIHLGGRIVAPEMPEKNNLPLVKNIDLKSGFRALISSSYLKHQIPIPAGYSCKTVEQAVKKAYLFSSKGEECIIKPDNGEDGIGQKRVPPDSSISSVLNIISNNKFLNHGAVVVEKFIESDNNIVSPSIEYYIKDDKLYYLYSCAQALSQDRTFLGVDIGPSILPTKIKREMIRMGDVFGRTLATLGYRGFFDIDFIVDKDQTVYAVESNLRRTGATHVHAIGQQLFGHGYENHMYLRSADVDLCVPEGLSISEIFNKLDPVLYPNIGRDRGVIVTISAGIPVGRLGYVVIGQSRQEIDNLQQTIYKLVA